MKFENQGSGITNLREKIERERKDSFKGYDTFLKELSLEDLLEPVTVSEICRNVNTWAQTYRGYNDEDSFYELIAQLPEKLRAYASTNVENGERENDFVSDISRIIDETFPIVEESSL